MSSTVFSLSLNELDMAKLGELQNKYPELSRNGMIRHIIQVMHSGKFDELEGAIQRIHILDGIIRELQRK